MDLTTGFNRFQFAGILLLVFVAALALGCAGTADTKAPPGPVHASNLSPLSPQPDDSAMAPGLAVVYFRSYFFRTLENLPSEGSDYEKQIGRSGEPLLELNHAFGKEAVFGSGESDLVALRATGLIHFPQTGEYMLQAEYNDGVFVYVDGQRVIDEGRWEKGGDRMSQPAFLDIQTAGWYPLKVEFYERKGTATLKLFWRAPGGSDATPIPPAAYAHLKSAE
jgi:hypothetical protein